MDRNIKILPIEIEKYNNNGIKFQRENGNTLIYNEDIIPGLSKILFLLENDNPTKKLKGKIEYFHLNFFGNKIFCPINIEVEKSNSHYFFQIN